MDLNKTISVAKVYVPNEYTVHLSTQDFDAFRSYETTLVHELATYLEAHARGSGYSSSRRQRSYSRPIAICAEASSASAAAWPTHRNRRRLPSPTMSRWARS